MALLKCKECGGEVSQEAKACPACGAPPPKGTSTSAIVVGGLFALIVGSCVANQSNAPSPSAKAPVDESKEKRFRTVVAGAKWLKENSKNPKSFELVSATALGDDVLCYVYRGTNSFNAVVTQRRVITNSVNSGDDKEWNRHCAGRSGEDFTYARQAL